MVVSDGTSAVYSIYNNKNTKKTLIELQQLNISDMEVTELRKIARKLNIQHRNIPRQPLITTLQTLIKSKCESTSQINGKRKTNKGSQTTSRKSKTTKPTSSKNHKPKRKRNNANKQPTTKVKFT